MISKSHFLLQLDYNQAPRAPLDRDKKLSSRVYPEQESAVRNKQLHCQY
jgi:hypothetical protein